MAIAELKKQYIQQRRAEFSKRYGSNPEIYSSGQYEKLPMNLIIHFPKIKQSEATKCLIQSQIISSQ